MRGVVFALATALLAVTAAAEAQIAPAQIATAQVSDALACDRAADPAVCLLRAGATGWTGESPQRLDVMSAVSALGLDEGDGAIRFGADKDGFFRQTRAVRAALLLDATGLAPEPSLAPIAALASAPGQPRGGEDMAAVYTMFAYGPALRDDIDGAWRTRLPRPSVAAVRTALARVEAIAAGQTQSTRAEIARNDIAPLAAVYAAVGLPADGRALLRRWNAENQATTYWLRVRNFAAAEKAIRSHDDVRAQALLWLAGAAAEAGDDARAARLARETLDRFVRGTSARIIVSDDHQELARAAARIMVASGRTTQVRHYARALATDFSPTKAVYGSHMDYAIDMLGIAGDRAGVCALTARFRNAVDAPVQDLDGEDLADEKAARAATATAAARYCQTGETNDTTSAADIASSIDADAKAGQIDRAVARLVALFSKEPFFAVSMAESVEANRDALLNGWRAQTGDALRTALLRRTRTTDEALTDDDSDYVFAAALSILDHDMARGRALTSTPAAAPSHR